MRLSSELEQTNVGLQGQTTWNNTSMEGGGWGLALLELTDAL